MILDLLLRIYAASKESLAPRLASMSDDEAQEEAWRNSLIDELKKHEGELLERNDELKSLIEKEEKEQESKITSEDIREGFSSGVCRQDCPQWTSSLH